MTSWMQVLTPEEAKEFRESLLRSYQHPCQISNPTDEEMRKYLERNTLQTLIKQEGSSVRNPLNRINDYLLKTSPN